MNSSEEILKFCLKFYRNCSDTEDCKYLFHNCSLCQVLENNVLYHLPWVKFHIISKFYIWLCLYQRRQLNLCLCFCNILSQNSQHSIFRSLTSGSRKTWRRNHRLTIRQTCWKLLTLVVFGRILQNVTHNLPLMNVRLNVSLGETTTNNQSRL